MLIKQKVVRWTFEDFRFLGSMVHVPKQKRLKLDSKSSKCVFMERLLLAEM